MRKVTGEELAERRRLWEKGLTDEEIAEAVGRTEKCIYYWRRRFGLERNSEKDEPKKQPVRKGAAKKCGSMAALMQDAAQARAAGMSYGTWRARAASKKSL